MSQRSHIAQSGSSEISECSAACSVESSFGIASSPSSCAGVGREPDRLGLEARRGQVERDRLDRVAAADRLALVADDLLGDRDAAEAQLEPEPRAPRAAARRSSVCVSFFACVYQSTRDGLDERGARVDVEPADEVLLAEVEVDGALVHRRVRARALDRGRARRRSPRRRPRTRRARRSGAATRAAG